MFPGDVIDKIDFESVLIADKNHSLGNFLESLEKVNDGQISLFRLSANILTG